MEFRGIRSVVVIGAAIMGAVGSLQATTLGELQYSRRIWQSAEGLPEDFAQSIAQTPDGYLWIGTSGGLLRFDGHRFVLFDQASYPTLTDDSVYTMLAGRDGALWIGTEGGGLLRWHEGRFQHFGERQGLTNGFVRVIHRDRKGTLWIGTDGGLFRMEGGRLVRVDGSGGIPRFSVHAIREDRRGRLLVGGLGLLVMDGVRTSFHTSPESLADNSIRAILPASDGSIWIGTISGVRRITSLEGNPFAVPRIATGVNSGVLMESSDGRIWVGAYGHGVLVYERGHLVRRLQAPSWLPHNNVLGLFEDSEKNIWVGTQGGLLRLSPSTAATLTTADGVPQSISTVYEDRDGNLLATGLNGSIYRVHDGVLQPLPLPPGIAPLRIRNAYRDSTGALWLGTDGQGALRITSSGVQHFTMRQGLVNDFIRAFCEDRKGNFWIGTDGGLSQLHGGVIRNYRAGSGLAYNSVRFVHSTRDGSVYVGTDDGLSRFRDGSFRDEPCLAAFKRQKAWCIHEDAAGALWIGTHGGGLFRLQDGRVSRITASRGLPSDKIHFIAEDTRGNLWMSTSAGVFSIPRRDLEAEMSGGAADLAFEVYGMSEGLSTNQMSGGVQPSGVMTRTGELWLPCTRGVVWIQPNVHGPGTRDLPPPVLIEEALADDRPVPVGNPLVLPPGKGKLEIHYTAIRLRSPERIRFKYWLEGFDHNWTEAGQRRAAYYTNIPPGQYRFHVVAYELNEPRNPRESVIAIHWKPHYYQTKWFLTLCSGLALGAAGLLYWLHIHNLRRRFAAVMDERNRLAREMHDTLIQGCVGLSALLEAAAHAHDVCPGKTKELLDRARQEARSAVAEARMAIWNLRHTTESDANLLDSVAHLVRQIGIETGIAVRLDSPGAPPLLDAETGRSLLLIIREALQNAAQHAAPKNLTVSLWSDPGAFHVIVDDDGCGFDPSRTPPASPHYGLIGMRERVSKLGGEFFLRSAPGQGTRVRISLPAGRQGTLRSTFAKLLGAR